MTAPDDFDSWLARTLKSEAAPPSAALLEAVLAIPALSVPATEPRFNFASLFTAWQKALAGGAVFASLLAGVVVGSVPTGSATLDAEWGEDVPGLSYSPGEWGDL